MSVRRTAIGAEEGPRSVFARTAGWGLIGITLVYYLTFFNYGIDLDDEGYLLLNATSILHGQWPVADFFSYGPLSYFLLALFFKVLGNNVLTERVVLMALILLNVGLIHYCAKKLLPASWAWLAAAAYGFAPGPWYKVFFISHLLLSLAALLYFLEDPGPRRAFLFGFTGGVAAISRIEAGAVTVVLGVGLLGVCAWLDSGRGGGAGVNAVRGRLATVLRFEGGFFLGASIPIAIALAAYLAVGKLPHLLHNIVHYYNEFHYIGYVNAVPGETTVFSVKSLFAAPSVEMWVYAAAMAACLANLARYGLEILARGTTGRRAFIGFAIAAFGIGSMGYTYYYVWNSRMLSSFAIVYINYFALLFAAQAKVSAAGARSGGLKTAVPLAVGIAAAILYFKSFIIVQNYSGSYTTNLTGGMGTVDSPVLRGIHVYADQVNDILKMLEHTDTAPAGSYLVSMSEATTMGYLARLPNPTYYRLFLTEFAPPGEQARAIQTFEHYRIRYFVARRSQFLRGGNHSSNLDAYAPQIKAYLLAKYRIIPLGDNFVLLERKVDS